MKKKTVYWLLVVTALFWGANIVAVKQIVSELPPVAAVGMRFFWVSLVLTAWVLFREGKKAWPQGRQWIGLFLLGVTGIYGNNVLVFKGVALTTASNASLLMATSPVLTTIFAWLFWKERLRLLQWIGVLLSFLGSRLVITRGSWDVLTSMSLHQGDLLIFGGAFFWTLYTLLGKRVMGSGGLSALATTAWSSCIGTVFLLGMTYWEGYRGALDLTAWGWVSMVYMVFCSGILAFSFWNYGVQQIGPQRAAIFSNIIPLAGVFSAWLLLNEEILLSHGLGALCILCGVWLTTQQ